MSECALSMLTALAEEVHNMDKGRRQELVAATGSQWDAIASLAQGFIPEQVAAGEGARAGTAAAAASQGSAQQQGSSSQRSHHA